MKKLFDNKTDYLVAAFIVGVALMLGYCESSNAAWSIEEQHDSNAGATDFNHGVDRICARYTYASGTSMYGCPLVAVGGGIRSDSFELGLADELWPRWEGEIRLNRFDGVNDGGASIRRMIGDGPFKLGLGISYWINESPGSDSELTFNLSIRYYLGGNK